MTDADADMSKRPIPNTPEHESKGREK